jgi:beta-glucuronidase
MLYPQLNPYRQRYDLSGIWDLRFDPTSAGEAAGWMAGFDAGQPVGVPASWNEQLADARDYLGLAWYQTCFDMPAGLDQQCVSLYFGSVNYLARIWLNGIWLGQHEGGHLPFAFEVTNLLRSTRNCLVVLVDGQLAPDRVPPGCIPPDPRDDFSTVNYPDTSYDFFPYCGIHRPVLLVATAQHAIEDVQLVTTIDGSDGVVQISIIGNQEAQSTARVTIRGFGANLSVETLLRNGQAKTSIRVPEAQLWAPGTPHLYTLTIELLHAAQIVDSYSLPVGIRTIEVRDDALLLNGQPIVLRGFGRHEDFPVLGRGYHPAVMVKDFALMQWAGANSFRTSHYPYAEEQLALADRLGLLVISETPSVGLFFHEDGLERRRTLAHQYLAELIARDKNHPSVIVWSMANEPQSNRPGATAFFRELYDHAKALDPTRPATIVSFLGEQEESFDFCDIVCLNRYAGWYTHRGHLHDAINALETDLRAMHERFRKPILITEFGADAIAGHHAWPPEMGSEEYQAAMIEAYVRLFDTLPFVVGQHVWNLCDFKTGQSEFRIGALNLKGVFTRDRRPKLAAHRLRTLWSADPQQELYR